MGHTEDMRTGERRPGSRWSLLAGLALLLGALPTLLDCTYNPEMGEGASPDAVGGLAGLALVPAFPRLQFERPVFLTQPESEPDGRDLIYVVEQAGVVHRFERSPGADTTEVFLDITERVDRGGNEEGLLGLAFHPAYARNGRLYVYYSAEEGGPLFGGRAVLSELRLGPDGRVDPASERILLDLDQPWPNHNGGMVAFGPDGRLYLGLGDGGLWGDPEDNAQDKGTLLGAILRIDVDGRTGDLPYGIPEDNPFVDDPEARGEIWAYGLRNPWRFSFDRETGELWVGDVGQDAWEEVNRVERGGNYGWPAYEGHEVYDDDALEQAADAIPPIAVYGRREGLSITGGYVYRGTAAFSLTSHYLYADFGTGAIWAIDRAAADPTPIKILLGGVPIASFGEDRQGELYVCGFDGRIYRFGAAEPVPPLPPRLSELGLFQDLERLQPVEGAVPYRVTAELWSDGAAKERFIVLPPGETFADEWVPVGTHLVKTFILDGVRLETRIIRRDPKGWTAGTYAWAEDLSDATLLPEGGTRPVTATVDGVERAWEWRFPSQSDCMACHTAAAGFVLGVRTEQLDRPDPEGRPQLERWREMGLLPPGAPSETARFVDPADPAAPLGERARSYLAANCAHCHQPGAPGNATFDLRFAATADPGDLVGAPAVLSGPEGPALLIAPGHPDASVLLQRMRIRGERTAMPPLASELADADGVALVRRWIEGMRSR